MPRSARISKKNKEVVVAQPKAPTLARTFTDGLAFGAGSSITHSIIRSITGATTTPQTTEQPSTVQPITVGEYKQCMTDYNDKAACAHLLNKE